MEVRCHFHDRETPKCNCGNPVPGRSASSPCPDSSAHEVEFDPGMLARSIDLPEETVLELLITFLSASWRDLKRIEAGIRSGNIKQVQEAAHSLKGAALNLEFNDISSAARSLELGESGDAINGDSEALAVIRLRLKAVERSIAASQCPTVW